MEWGGKRVDLPYQYDGKGQEKGWKVQLETSRSISPRRNPNITKVITMQELQNVNIQYSIVNGDKWDALPEALKDLDDPIKIKQAIKDDADLGDFVVTIEAKPQYTGDLHIVADKIKQALQFDFQSPVPKYKDGLLRMYLSDGAPRKVSPTESKLNSLIFG